MESSVLNENVREGIHPYAESEVRKFPSKQQDIVKIFKAHWYVTKASQISLGASSYNYILIKAPSNFAEQFNLYAEVTVIFSDYEIFEPRTLDAFDFLKKQLELGRVENLCGILVSKDDQIVDVIKRYLSEQETRIIVPFSYSELLQNKNDSFIFRNKLRNYFYSRDLFAFNNPLKTDLYFFGRSQIVLEIINKHLTNQNSGLFGLRKTGKTSIIHDIKRKLPYKNAIGVFIDCESPAITNRRWYKAIYYIIKQIYEEAQEKLDIDENDFTEVNAPEYFEYYLKELTKKSNLSILLLFDEIENITFGKSPNENWCNGLEHVFFWQTIRSVYHKGECNFTFCLVGTNPRCIEMPSILGKDNPIFNIITPTYIPGFDVQQTREMVRKLGRMMGIKFDETLYSKMTEEYGGHPFLIRHLCSTISRLNPNRPITIDRIKYNAASRTFNNDHSDYFEMLIDVLRQFYPDEYEMLNCLALNDTETFYFFANEDYSYIKHLIGYGIIYENDGNYDFKIDAIRDYLKKKNNSRIKFNTIEEKWSNICTRRGNIEIELRKVVKQVLAISYKGKENAKQHIVDKILGSKSKYITYTYDDLFDPKKSEIYLKNLTTLIKCNWEFFSSFISPMSQEDFIYTMNVLNQEGRFDAHAKIPDENDMILFNAAIDKIEKIINRYKELYN